jgi:antitoxin (DNA-binding transcriptional repressor) of toxin-antitoxin stability system
MKTISVSQLKSSLCAELKMVREGDPLVVLDHNHPIARVIPYRLDEDPDIRLPLHAFSFARHERLIAADSIASLLEERKAR